MTIKKRIDGNKGHGSTTKDKKAHHAFIRWRTHLLLGLLALALLGWFVYLLDDAGNHNRDPFERPLVWMVLSLLFALMFVHGYFTRFSRCPKCGAYQLGVREELRAKDRRRAEGNYFIRFWKSMFSHAPTGYWLACRNCGHREWNRGVCYRKLTSSRVLPAGLDFVPLSPAHC